MYYVLVDPVTAFWSFDILIGTGKTLWRWIRPVLLCKTWCGFDTLDPATGISTSQKWIVWLGRSRENPSYLLATHLVSLWRILCVEPSHSSRFGDCCTSLSHHGGRIAGLCHCTSGPLSTPIWGGWNVCWQGIGPVDRHWGSGPTNSFDWVPACSGVHALTSYRWLREAA